MSPWESFTPAQLAESLKERIEHTYLKTDGTVRLPNSIEGDILKMACILAAKLTGTRARVFTREKRCV